MKQFAGAAFILLTLQLTASTPREQTNNPAPGNFTGRITDETGKPVIGVPVQALQYISDATGVKTLQQFGAVRSNDRGDYRLFMLPPGRYYIGVGDVPGQAERGVPGGASSGSSSVRYAFRYYPGVSDITQASTLEIFPGSDTHADLKAVPQ